MKKLIAAAMAAVGLVAIISTPPARAGQKPDAEKVASARLPFLANAGQLDPRVAYYTRTFAGSVYATRDGELIYALPTPRKTGWVLREWFVGGHAAPSGGARSNTQVSMLTSSRTLPDIAAHESVKLGEVWPGIDVEVHARGNNIEKIFTLAPGADDDTIEVAIDGATLSIARDGSLVATTDHGPLSFAAPIAFQEGRAGRESVDVRYRLEGDRYGFELGDYDSRRPVVIDPIIQSTFIGGSGSSFLQEGPRDLAVHPTNGDVYVAGATDSADLPGVAGGAVPALSGNASGFITRFNADLTTLHQATFFGGNADEWISSLVVTATDVYVSGYTAAATLPAGTTAGAQPTDPNPGADFNGFIARLPLSLTSVTASTYLGGTTNHATQIYESMLHPNGDLYVCGRTNSGSVPATAGGFDAANSPGNRTAFVTRLAADLTAFEQTTYFSDGGFSGATECNAMVAMPGSNEVVIGGLTHFGSFPPPNTAGGLTTTTTGSWLARLDETLTQNPQSTWLTGVASGSGTPGVYGLRVHPSNGDLYVLTEARTDSPQPASATVNGGQATCTGTFPCLMVLRVSPSLTSLVAGTFYGNPNSNGSSIPRAYDHLALDPASGDVFVVSDAVNNLPNTAGGIQPAPLNTAGTPGLAVRIRADLGQIVQATYLSGADTVGTSPNVVLVHPSLGQLYVAGHTGEGFPQTSGGAQPAAGSSGDGFVSRMTLDLLGSASTGVLQVSPATYTIEEGDTSVQITVTRTGGTDGAASVSYATSDDTATAGSDYTATTGTLNWVAGDGTAKTIDIAVLEDTTVENAETITLTLSNATGATLGTSAAATITITDDDVAPEPGVVQFAAASYSGNENGGSVTLTLTRTNGADGAISVNVASGGGSASAGADYSAVSQTVSWADGDAASKTVALAIINDTADESDETVSVTLSTATGGATFGAITSATVTIVDDDVAVIPPPPPPPAPTATETKGSYGGGSIDAYWLALLGLLLLRRRRWLVAIACSAAGVSAANSAESVAGPYVGLRAGISQSTLDAGDIERRLAASGFAMDVSLDDQDAAYTVFGGYRWSSGLTIEASYVDLGEFDVSMRGSTTDPAGLLPAAVNSLADAGQGGALTVGWQWQLTSAFSLTPRIGMYYWESERELANAAGRFSEEDSATEVTGGLTAAWSLGSRWAIGLNWDAYDAGDHQDIHAWTASVEYRFGGR